MENVDAPNTEKVEINSLKELVGYKAIGVERSEKNRYNYFIWFEKENNHEEMKLGSEKYELLVKNYEEGEKNSKIEEIIESANRLLEP